MSGLIPGIRARLAAAGGAALVGFKAKWAGSVARTVAARLNDEPTLMTFGAKGDGVTDDGAAFAAPVASVLVPAATYNGPNGFSLAGYAYRSAGPDAVLTGTVTLNAGSVIDGLTVTNATANAVQSLASGIAIKNASISAPAASAIEVEGANGITGVKVSGSTITANNYGVVLSMSGYTGGAKISTVNCDISTVTADCIEYNCPAAGFTGTIAALNFLQNTATSGAGSAGFGIGIAAAKYNVVAGNVILNSRLEMIHIESDQRGTVVIGNTGAGQTDGIRVYEATDFGNLPVAIVANTLENSQATASDIGINLYWSTPGTPAGDPVVANVLNNYNEGISVGGSATGEVNTVQPVTANTLVGVNYGVTAWGNSNLGTVRQSGTNVVLGKATLFMTKSAGTRFGKVITNTTPTAIAANTKSGGYGGVLPSMMDGFEFPLVNAIAVSTTAGGATLFTAGGPYHGRIKFQAKGNSPNTNWCHISADIQWDGTNWSISNVLSRVAGVITSISITQSASTGNPYVNMRSSSACTLNAGWIEFDGEWWDA